MVIKSTVKHLFIPTITLLCGKLSANSNADPLDNLRTDHPPSLPPHRGHPCRQEGGEGAQPRQQVASLVYYDNQYMVDMDMAARTRHAQRACTITYTMNICSTSGNNKLG